MNKRMLHGTAIIIFSMITATLMSFVYLWLIKHYPENQLRFDLIFGIGGTVIGIAAVAFAIGGYTNNFGNGYKNSSDS